MCSNYKTVTQLDHLLSFFGVEREDATLPWEFDADVWPLRLAPMIRLDERGRRCVEAGQFGLLPHFAKEVKYGRRTYNARSETVAEKPSFRSAWSRAQRCIIPVERIYEPCYESGSAVRWAIERADGEPIGVAGIYTEHPTLTRSDGEPLISFAMLTVSGSGHPIFDRMHAPQDEKRMVVILESEDYEDWLTCSPEEARSFFRQYQGRLHAEPAPLPPRKKGRRGAAGASAA